ncbi:hypothetical protein N399_21985 [Bacillus licheniformis CG-B52]|nr:hypothetical protein N399_21985 [Bacillus licheniformis CG-B52]KUL12079.1 hypothetical protein LI17339_05060 [Bacillus licheniformis LMG 17339]
MPEDRRCRLYAGGVFFIVALAGVQKTMNLV